jgi:uncharacterized protein (TIGR04255 family)
MGKKYANPPVEEAVCEFRMIPETRWDLTVPGLLYERLKETFPQKEQRMIQEVELTQGPEGLQQQIRTNERLGFFTEDRKMLAQVGPRLLVVNALKPYPHWEGFKPRIEMVWRNLQETIEAQGLERIGLRYINRIELPAQSIELGDYFEFYPFVGKRLPQQMVSFLAGMEFSYADGRDHCRVQLAPIPLSGKEGKAAFILDLDYFLARPRGVAVADALAWVEEAHSRVEEVFEGCITDKLRNMFDEVL